MKIRSLIFFIVSISLSMLVACASATGPSVAPATTPPGTSPSGQVRFMTNEDPEELGGFRDLITAFAKVQPNVKVTLQNIPDDDAFNKALAADFAAKTPPDVFVINYRFFGQFAIKGALQPIDTYIANSKVYKPADFYPAALQAFQFKGQQYCIPQNLSSLEVYYNKKLFAAANVPLPKAGWTWNDFLSAAKALTKDTNGDGKPDQYGAGIAVSTVRLAPFIWAHGGELVDDVNRPTRLTIDSPAAREALQWFVNLQVKEHVVPSRSDEATQDSQTRFEHGTLAMFFQSRVITPELRDTIKDFEWDVAPFPGDKHTATILHSDGYCMTAGSKNKDAAWAFIEFANGPVGQSTIVASGRTVPSLQAIAQSPAFLGQNESPANSKVYLDMAPNIRRVPVMTTWVDVEDVLNAELVRAFYGDGSVDQAISNAVKMTQEYFTANLKDLDAK